MYAHLQSLFGYHIIICDLMSPWWLMLLLWGLYQYSTVIEMWKCASFRFMARNHLCMVRNNHLCSHQVYIPYITVLILRRHLSVLVPKWCGFQKLGIEARNFNLIRLSGLCSIYTACFLVLTAFLYILMITGSGLASLWGKPQCLVWLKLET